MRLNSDTVIRNSRKSSCHLQSRYTNFITDRHRRERVSGEFDRTLSLPVQIEPDGIKAEYRDGILALFLPRAERDKPRSIKIT